MTLEICYILAAILFIVGLKRLNSPTTARNGNMLSAVGMFLAVAATLCSGDLDYRYIVAGLVIGGAIGGAAARMIEMTAIPEMVALFNGFGGIASLLVGWGEFHSGRTELGSGTLAAIGFAVVIGGVTFSGSVTAYGKLSGKIAGRPVMFTGQQLANAILLIVTLICSALMVAGPGFAADYRLFAVIAVLSLVLGVLAVLPIGGADMPVVISLLNSYSGLAACAAGFVILNKVLIVSGALVGASGIILTKIMCKAMNRSLTNVLFSGFGATVASHGAKTEGAVNPMTPDDAYYVLEAARSVVIAPGYGMAVAQAQHVVRELGQLLEDNGCEVHYAIHPVAGRMPGHMNVLLAEANVPYDQLVEPDAVNSIMETVDVGLVIGANDVVNPAARDDKNSPIYGMPVIDIARARTVFVLKRSMASGFAGIENPLFFRNNTRMLFGDAKSTVSALVASFKA